MFNRTVVIPKPNKPSGAGLAVNSFKLTIVLFCVFDAFFISSTFSFDFKSENNVRVIISILLAVVNLFR